MYTTVDNIKNEISFDYPIDNRNGNKKEGLIRAYFVFSFYNVKKDEKINLKNGETLKVRWGFYTMIGKSVIDPTISQLGPCMKKILGINNGTYINTLLKLTNCQPRITYSRASHVTYCILGTLIKTYHLVISFTSSKRIFNIKN